MNTNFKDVFEKQINTEYHFLQQHLKLFLIICFLQTMNWVI